MDEIPEGVCTMEAEMVSSLSNLFSQIYWVGERFTDRQLSYPIPDSTSGPLARCDYENCRIRAFAIFTSRASAPNKKDSGY